MKKKNLAIALALVLAMVFTIAPRFAFPMLAADDECEITYSTDISNAPLGVYSLDEALDKVYAADSGAQITIKLLTKISYNKGILVTNKVVTLDVNGKILDVTNGSGHGLEVGSGGKMMLIDSGTDGQFNVKGGGSGARHGVYAHDGGVAEVTNATTAGTGTDARGANAVGTGTIVTVYGNVIFGGFYGLGAASGATLTVYGNVEGGGGMAVSGVGTTVTVYGYSNGGGTGVYATDGVTVYVKGNVYGGGAGVYASTGAQVTVDGFIRAYTGGQIYIQLGGFPGTSKMQEDYEPTSSKDGYFEYNDNTSYVWVKYFNPPLIRYTVTYEPGEHGAFTAVTHTDLKDGATTPDAPEPIGEGGWKFVEWSPAVSPTVTGNAVYVAKWLPNDFNIIYNSNGGNGSMGPDTAAYGADVTLSPNAFYRAGYHFIGWNTEADGSGTFYADGYTFEPWTLEEDLSLYAQWEPNQYTITYVPNGGSGSMAPDTVLYGENITLSPNAFTRYGFTFIGWCASPQGIGIHYPDGWTFDPYMYNGDFFLYAQWKANPPVSLIVTFDKNTTGTTIGPNPTSKTVILGEAYGTLATVSRSGYTFGGWYLNAECTGSAITDISIVVNPDNHTLYARWIPNTNISYVVHYYLAGTTTSLAPDKTVGNQTMGVSITENAITITGYTAVAPTSITKILEASGNEFIFYYTQNPVITYTVTVNDSNASNTGAGSYAPTTIVTINAGTKAGYTFTGWTINSGNVTLADLKNPTTTFSMPANNVVVTANWEKDAVVITDYTVNVIDSNATITGTGSYTPGTTVTIHAGSKDGYTFTGWTVTSGNVTLADLKNPTTTFSMPANNVVVTANWEEEGDTTGGGTGAWALVNLILCAIGIVVALFAVIKAFFWNKKGDKNKDTKETRMLWLLITVIAGIVGVIVFFVTENMSLPMRLVDWWTIVNAVILVLGVVGAMLAFKRKTITNR